MMRWMILAASLALCGCAGGYAAVDGGVHRFEISAP